MTSVSAARKFVAGALMDLPQRAVDDAELIVSELAANAVSHANSPFSVYVHVDTDVVRLEVRDVGDGDPQVRTPNDDEPVGRGLRIVERVAKDWGVESHEGGKTVWASVPSRRHLPVGEVELATERVDDLIPWWVFMLSGRVVRAALAVGVSATAALVMSRFAEPQTMYFGPWLTLLLVLVAVLGGAYSVAIAGPLLLAAYWYYGVPPGRSFTISSGLPGVIGLASLQLLLLYVVRRLERTAVEIRAMGHALREQTVTEAHLRHRAERTASQAEAVLQIGRALTTAHTPQEVAAMALRGLDLPTTPTSAAISLLRDGKLEVLASVGSPRQLLRKLEDLDLSQSAWLGSALQGEPVFVEDRDSFAAKNPNAMVLQMFRSGSWAVVPFRSESLQGLLSVHYREARPLIDFNLYFSLVGELLGSSLERARSEQVQRHQHVELEHSFAERDRIARTLSTTLLPPALPHLGDFEAAGWLMPASADEVAGDFYDVFRVADGGWVAVLGDVCGKGAEAAAVTSLTRYAIRATALDNPDPANVARVANAALVADTSDLFCTAAIVRSLPGGEDIEVALAGHLQPRLVTSEGVQRLGVFNAALGLATDSPETVRYAMPRGSTVVLFSDGLVERDPQFREPQLEDFLARTRTESAQELANAIRSLVPQLAAKHPDDIAVLVLRRR